MSLDGINFDPGDLSPDVIRRVFEHLRNRDLEVRPTLVSPAAYDAIDLWFVERCSHAPPDVCSVCRGGGS